MFREQELQLKEKKDHVIVSGSTWAAIWHMSWPLLLNMGIISLGSFFDIWVAGKLGTDTQAALGIGGQIWFFMVILVIALSVGTTALVSRFWGAGDKDSAIEAARQAIVVAFIIGLLTALLGLATCRYLMRLLGASCQVEALGWNYLKYELSAQLPHTVLWIASAIFRAKGNARVPMMIMGLITGAAIVLETGFCLFPFHMGIAGIGLAWLIATASGAILILAILRSSEIGQCMAIKSLFSKGLPWQGFVRLMAIGGPACVTDLAWVAGNFVLYLILAHTSFPTACQAAWAIGLRCEEMVGTMPMYALSLAIATIVGQNLGAKQVRRAEHAGWQVASVGAAVNTIVGLVLYFAAAPIAAMLSNDARVIEYSISYFQWLAFCQPALACWIVLFGAMQGAGYTRRPMVWSLICLTVIRLPLAWFATVTLGMGPAGTWMSLSATTILIGALACLEFKAGPWKLQKV